MRTTIPISRRYRTSTLLERWAALAAALCLLVAMHSEFAFGADRAPQSPVRIVRVGMVKGALPGFLEQLRNFADANEFAIRAAQSSPDSERFLVQLWREDIKGIGVNTSDFGAADLTYSIAFYRNCNDEIPEGAFDVVVTRLHKMLSETDGVVSVDRE